MDKTIRALRRKGVWIVAAAMVFVAMAGMVSQPQRTWAQPPVPETTTSYVLGSGVLCGRGPSPEFFLRVEEVRTPLPQYLIMLAKRPAQPLGRATVVEGAYTSDREEGNRLLRIYREICELGLVPSSTPAVRDHVGLTTVQPEEPFSFEAGHGVTDVTVADFNNDGIDDLVFSNDGSDTVSILLGAADLTLGPATAFAAGDGPEAVATGDLNQDGNVDVITANAAFPNTDLTVMFGNGDGTLQAPISLAGDTFPIDVAVGDLNGDTIADIVFTAQNTGILTIISNGDGTFQDPTALDNNLFPISVQLVDMNADGTVDILSSAAIRTGNGDGTFQPPFPFPTNMIHAYADAGDLNNDGVLDAVAVSSRANAITVMLGIGDGTLQNPVHYALGNRPQFFEIVESDGDDFAHLVVSNTNDDHITVLFGNGDGTFVGAPLYPASRGAAGMVVADFTGDGIDDIATGSNSNRPIAILPGLEPGRYGAALLVDNLRGTVVAGGDVNHDGNPDLLIPSSPITVALGNGDGTFDNATMLQRPDQDNQGGPAIALDVNNDTNLDIVTVNNDTPDVSIFLGHGDGTFQAPSQIALGVAPSAFSLIVQGLFNADADPDLAIVTVGDFNALTGSVSILLGDGAGSFTVGQNLVPNTQPRSTVTGDFNNDGNDDLAVYFFMNSEASARIFLGHGDGTFEPPATIPFNDFFMVNAPNVGDFNLDGNVDLLISLENSNVSILHGFGDGTFGEPVPYDAGAVGGQTVVADLNLDSRPDILVANTPPNRGNVVVLINITPIDPMVPIGE